MKGSPDTNKRKREKTNSSNNTPDKENKKQEAKDK
jgi:hypothetical protein